MNFQWGCCHSSNPFFALPTYFLTSLIPEKEAAFHSLAFERSSRSLLIWASSSIIPALPWLLSNNRGGLSCMRCEWCSLPRLRCVVLVLANGGQNKTYSMWFSPNCMDLSKHVWMQKNVWWYEPRCEPVIHNVTNMYQFLHCDTLALSAYNPLPYRLIQVSQQALIYPPRLHPSVSWAWPLTCMTVVQGKREQLFDIRAIIKA